MKNKYLYKIRKGNFLINTWLLTPFTSEETGVNVRIWISDRQCIFRPFLIVAQDLDSIKKNGIIVSIEKRPKILSPKGKSIEPKNREQLYLWIRLNRKALYLLWSDKIGLMEFCFELMKKI
ncbi:MAG: hypothetical protein K2J46_07890 [Muribaculaceae bacterium]|nr:hypothetical protein [Muribaculaceae bacterium]